MPRRYWNDGQEIIQGDLNAASSSLEIELYDRLLYEVLGRQQNFCFQNSFLCSYINSTTSQVALGNGNYYDNTQVDPEPMNRLLAILANTNVTHTAADGSHNRIDIICITPARSNVQSATRNYKDPNTSVISSVSMVVETDWLSTLSVVAGTPGVSPAVPSTPAGAIKLAEVLVTAATGIAGAGAYTDKRPRFNKKRKVTNYTSGTSAVDIDDEIITANAVGGAITLNFPAASLMTGKSLSIVKTDSSGNTVTLSTADLIVGASTQVLSSQYESLRFYCDGSTWYLE